mmetsp:Transcript_26546/g.43118  ORF Transcript_26546/g.43118 Transcript_26546/m.43118 type:complete len:142 (+) Transcript_26546:17-442(+)
MNYLSPNKFGAARRIQLEIRRAWQFRFNWFFKSRSPQEIQKRCDMLIRVVEREVQEHRDKEAAKEEEAQRKVEAQKKKEADAQLSAQSVAAQPVVAQPVDSQPVVGQTDVGQAVAAQPIAAESVDVTQPVAHPVASQVTSN